MNDLHRQIYDCIEREHQQHKPQPSVAEIAKELGKGISTISRNLRIMESLGYVTRRGARAVKLNRKPEEV